MKKLIITSSFLLLILSGCQEKNKNNMTANKPKQNTGLKLQYMDTTVRPQDDFYNFVNGEWMKKTKIPADRSRW